MFGVVAVVDRIWRSHSQSYIRPLPGRLGVRPRGRSQRLERVLTDFGCEHSFARAASSVLEHYGFAIGVSAVRDATLDHAHRAQAQLKRHHAESFRVLPAVGPAHVIAEADGTMICTVAAGPRKGKRPRQWQEMRPWSRRRPRTAASPFMGPPLAAWRKRDGVGAMSRGRAAGD